MNIVLGIVLLISIPIAIYFLKKKIAHTLWFLKVRYAFRILGKSIILVGLAYTFVTTSFAYLTYPKYMAILDGYHEFNTTSEEGVKKIMYNAIYKFQVDKKTLSITDTTISTSSKSTIGKYSEVLYKDSDFMLYRPMVFLVASLIGMGVFYYFIHLIKNDFVKKPLMPKKPFWGHTSTSHEVSISLNLNQEEDSKDE
jgi:hypothetical protein